MKIKTLTAFVIFCILTIIIYIITAIVLQVTRGVTLEPTLTDGIIKFFGTELCVAGVLKIFKIRKE